MRSVRPRLTGMAHLRVLAIRCGRGARDSAEKCGRSQGQNEASPKSRRVAETWDSAPQRRWQRQKPQTFRLRRCATEARRRSSDDGEIFADALENFEGAF